MEKPYIKKIKEFYTRSNKSLRDYLRSIGDEKLQNLTLSEKSAIISYIYTDYHFFPSKDVYAAIEKILNFGAREGDRLILNTKWFIEFETILNAIYKINRGGNLILRAPETIYALDEFISSKIIEEVQRTLHNTKSYNKKIGKVSMASYHAHSVVKSSKRKSNGSIKLKKYDQKAYQESLFNNIVDLDFNYILTLKNPDSKILPDLLEKYGGDKNLLASNILIHIAEGQTEHLYLRYIYDSVIKLKKKLSERKILIELYDFFQLVCKGGKSRNGDLTKVLLTEEEFQIRVNNIKYKNLPFETSNFYQYKYKALRSLLQLNK